MLAMSFLTTKWRKAISAQGFKLGQKYVILEINIFTT